MYVAYVSIWLMLCYTVVVAALDGVYGGVGGVHPGSGAAGAQRQPGDDAGLQTFYGGKSFVLVWEFVGGPNVQYILPKVPIVVF